MAAASRRRFGRRQSCILAAAKMPGRRPIRCIIRNISEGGALLDFGYKVEPSATFEMEIEGYGLKFHCETRHKGNHGVGVCFLNGDPAPLLRELDSPLPPASIKAMPIELAQVEKPVQPSRFDALAFRRQRYG